MRICINCHTEKPLADFFYENSDRHANCRLCRNAYVRGRRAAIKSGTWQPSTAQRGRPLETTNAASGRPSSRELVWAAGFLEAEGWLRVSKSGALSVGAGQNSRPPIDRLQKLFGGGLYVGEMGGKPYYTWTVYAQRAHGVMLTLYPFLSVRRKNQIRKALRFDLLPDYVPTERSIELLPTGLRRCKICGEVKTKDRFTQNARKLPTNDCRECKANYLKAYQQARREGTWQPCQTKGLGIQRLTTPRAEQSPTVLDLEWAAGFLEGEGHFRAHGDSFQVAAPQVNREPLDRLQGIFGGTIALRRQNRNAIFDWNIYGPRARGVALTLFSFLSERRQDQIHKALTSIA